MTDTPTSVSQRYDELVAELTWWRTVDAEVTLDDDHHVARAAVVGEARLLDDGRLDEWLDGWATDGLLWVPIDPSSHPGSDQAYFLDDVRRLRERLQWRRQPSAWSQSPAPQTVRTVTNIESHVAADRSLRIRSTLTIFEQRAATSHVWAGHQFHVLTPPAGGGGRRRRLKVICVPALMSGIPHPGVLL